MCRLSAFVAGRRRQLCIADIPGLVEGAHRNVGLGHSFQRHVERSAGLVYVVDASGGVEGGEEALPWEQLQVLRAELEAYQPVRPRPLPSSARTGLPGTSAPWTKRTIPCCRSLEPDFS